MFIYGAYDVNWKVKLSFTVVIGYHFEKSIQDWILNGSSPKTVSMFPKVINIKVKSPI